MPVTLPNHNLILVCPHCRKTLFITGASRGIGKAIALRAARDGANIAIAAKTAEPHPKLPGTVYTAAKERTYTPHHQIHILSGQVNTGFVG